MINNSNNIEKINEYLKEQLWMDFEMCNMNRGKLELHGFLDEGDDDNIKITFEQPYLVNCNFFFTYEGKESFISMVDGEDAFQINKRYGVTQGNFIYKFTNTNIAADMFIVAKGIEFQIMK